jgi:Rrf2 family protein
MPEANASRNARRDDLDRKRHILNDFGLACRVFPVAGGARSIQPLAPVPEKVAYFFIQKSTMVSVTAQYALRALTHLASLAPGRTIGGRDLARAANIPQNYLSKILWTLGTARVIDATRGTGGGYRLRRPAQSVRLVEIVELFDKGTSADDCFLDSARSCSDDNACTAHSAWREVKAAYIGFLEHTTLAALATRQVRPRAAESHP